MADRDVTLDVVVRDKSGPAINSVNRNLKSVEKSWKDVDGQGKRTIAAASKIAGDWGRGLSKIGGAAKRWADSGDGAGKKFAKGLSSGIEKLGELGSAIGKGLSSAVTAAGPYVQVAIAAILVGAAVAAMPAVGAAIVGGAAGAGIVGGLVLAAKDARVAGAFESLKTQVTSQLQDAAQSFVPAALDAINTARSAFRRMLPDIQRIFGGTSGFVEPLTRSLGKALGFVVAGIAQAVEKAGPIIDAIGDGVIIIGKAVGDVFKRLSDNGTTMAAALKGVFYAVAGAIYIFSLTLNAVIETVEWVINKIPWASAALDKFVGSGDRGKESAKGVAGGFQLLGDNANGAAAGISNLKAKADEFTDSNISLARAQIAARDATRTASAAITDNAKAKISNKEKTDKNMTALLNMADAFNTEADAGDRSGISAGKASAAYATNREKLIKMAEKAGYSRQKAEELALTLLKQPKNVHTDVNVNTKIASSAVETFQRKIDGLHGKTVLVNVRVNSDGSHHVSGKGGSGTLLFSGYGAQFAARGEGVSRTGGPTKVESTVNQHLSVSLDGKPFYSYVDTAIAGSERRTAWRTKVGRR